MDIQTYEVGGKGRKSCPHCNKYVAARVLVCACGYSFQEGIVTAKVVAEKDLRHTTGGKGLRQCGGCGSYVSVRATACPCGYVFEKVVKEVKDIPTFTSGGRGKKLCSACGVYVGARVLVCVCGHNFHAEASEEIESTKASAVEEAVPAVVKPVVERDEHGNRYKVVVIPAGKCPIKLTSTSEESVLAWAQSVLDHGRKCLRTYATSALRYWVRDYYEIGTPEYRAVCEILGEMFLRQSA